MKNGLNFGLVMEAVTVTDYDALTNKPSINGVPLVGNKTGNDLLLVSANGTYPDLTAGNIVPKNTSPQAVTNKLRLQTTGGDEDLLTGNSFLDSIKGNLDESLNPFIADTFVSTGLNLVDPTQFIIINSRKAYIFPVPKCAFGSYGTTEQNNGLTILSDVTPTYVYFSQTKPTENNYGTSCPYATTDPFATKKYYIPGNIGWLVIVMPNDTVPACHMEWSGTYENVAGTFSNVNKTISTALQAVHTWGLAGIVGAERSVFDELDFVAGKGYARIDRGLMSGFTWTKTTYTDENEVVHYVYNSTVSGMAANGLWRCNTDGLVVENTTLTIESTTITTVEDLVASFGASEFFYYEKASVTSTNIAGASALRANTVNDYGLTYFLYNGDLANVAAYVTEEFYQSGKDQLFNNVSYVRGEMSEVIAAALAEHEEKINGILSAIENGFPVLKAQEVVIARKLSAYIAEGNFFISGAGAPAVIPLFSGQHYYDTTNNVWYVAGFTGTAPTASAWKQITNA